MTKRSKTTDEVLVEMLKENTGTHFLDSGGAYGRHWQRNQAREFDKEPETTLSFKHDEISVTHNLYHWLRGRVDYDAEMDERFHRWARHPSRADWGWMHCMVAWADAMKEKYGEKQGRVHAGVGIGFGPYGESTEPNVVYTYNEENLLSQDIQFLHFCMDGEEYVLLQIHGGCDARGGMTRPRAFRCSTDDMGIYDYARANIECEKNGDHNWYTDDGYHWYWQGSCGSIYDAKQLDKLKMVRMEHDGYVTCDRQLEPHEKHAHKDGDDPLCHFAQEVETADFVRGVVESNAESDWVIPVDQDGNGYCPECGGKLTAGFY